MRIYKLFTVHRNSRSDLFDKSASFALTIMSTIQDTQPGAVPSPSPQAVGSAPDNSSRAIGSRLFATKQKLTTKHGWFGDYNYGWLCIPPLPFTKSYNQRSPPFYGLHDDLPLVLAASTGLQHALAMLAGMVSSFYHQK